MINLPFLTENNSFQSGHLGDQTILFFYQSGENSFENGKKTKQQQQQKPSVNFLQSPSKTFI